MTTGTATATVGLPAKTENKYENLCIAAFELETSYNSVHTRKQINFENL